jgi:Cd2+/Zn2+-exporting ATPase
LLASPDLSRLYPQPDQVSVISKLVTVTHDPSLVSPAAVVAALNGVGLRARLMAGGRHGEGAVAAAEAAGAAAGGGAPHGPAAGWRPPWQVLVCGALVLVSTASIFAPAGARVWLEACGLAAAALGCPPVLFKAWSSLKGRILDINSLMAIAAVGAIALGDWTEAGALVFLFSLAEWLEAKCMGRAAGALEEVLRMQPETALLLDATAADGSSGGGCTGCSSAACGASSGAAGKPGTPKGGGKASCGGKAGGASGGGGGGSGYSRVPASSLNPGDLVLVRPGDRVPVDGAVTAGSSTVDESMLTGESRAVAKRPGSRALAGTVNNGTAALTVRVESAPEDSTVARLGALIEQAGQSKSKRDRAIEVRLVSLSRRLCPIPLQHLYSSLQPPSTLALPPPNFSKPTSTHHQTNPTTHSASPATTPRPSLPWPPPPSWWASWWTRPAGASGCTSPWWCW